MALLLRIAWRNLWRNPKRSLVLISAVVVCIASLILTLAYINGMLQQMVQSSIEFHIGEIEIYAKGFNEDRDPARHIRRPDAIYHFLEETESVRSYAPRVEGRGLISSSRSSAGVQIVGIEPEKEASITLVKRSVTAGSYPSTGRNREILIGERTARRLKVGVGDKVVLTVQTVRNELAADAFTVCGVFRTISKDFDRYMVYIPIDAARKLLEIEKGITGIAVRTVDLKAAEKIKSLLAKSFGDGVEVFTWGELEPLVMDMVEISRKWTFIFFVAIFIILSIGIINTQNIAVYERMHEIGVIRALGTGPLFIFSMIMAETFFLGLVGLVVGFIVTYPAVLYFSVRGLDLALFAEGLQMLGLGATIYFDIGMIDILYCALSVLVTSFLGAFAPALRASRLEPVRAMRYV